MYTLRHFRLELRPPRRGWLPFRFEFDDLVVEDRASNVLTDPIVDFLELMRFAAESPKPAYGPSVSLWLEPDGYSLDSRASSETSTIDICFQYYRRFLPPDGGAGDRTILRCDVQCQLLYDGVRKGLTAILEGPDADALDRWRDGESASSYLARLRRSTR